MKERPILKLMLALALLLLAPVVLADSPRRVEINSTETDFAIGRIFINGRNFTLNVPTVKLADIPLTVLTSTDTRIIESARMALRTKM